METNKLRIRLLRYGDEDSFKQLYLEYYSKLQGIGKRFNFKFLTPEDFVQETFIKLYKSKEQLKEDVLLDKQIYVICRNIILNHLKKEKRSISLVGEDLIGMEHQENDQDSELMDKKKKELSRLIKQLPEKRKEVFTLHKIEQYTYEEIAEITQLSKKTIANHIYLANKFILENLKKITL
ncbi:RNA polymerase sigma factor [Zhouia amylolytica]|nr:RNA polymerase sigma factor [Zhouia amylolytica]MCQ0112463.1 RNA polymerase sigma factor [Zhouia amylolytica]